MAQPNAHPAQETEESALLPALHEFEITIIARFLTAKEKLLTMAILNRKWRRLISKHYVWSTLPQRGTNCLLSGFADFLDGFSEFTGIRIPDFPG